ncbi:MAG: Rpn family recombination-promoting nuclease/putative transposase [Fibromonadaceae bacterium]|jgi:predicted transposase/invertase (TIGR01784 family)|nr:Rpn family recombination-promoting nuclease/putative transposase [Fibromonadaceae bacterium]
MPKNKNASKKEPAQQARFAKLTLDFTFKRVFASESEQSSKFLISLIESFLGEYLQAKVKAVQLLPSERTGKGSKRRAAVFDLHCTDSNGNRFIIEMQLAKQDFFMGRMLFYVSATITGIVKKGKGYKFNLPRIFSLSFLNFEPDLENEADDLIYHIGLTNLKHPRRRHGSIHFALVVLPRFKKALEQCETTLDLWLYLFKNLHKLDSIPARFRRSKFRGVFDIAEISNFTESELRDYEAAMKEIDVYNATIAYAKREGVLEGFGRGEKAGFGRGVKQGFGEGDKAGFGRGMRQAASNFKSMGFSAAQISKATGLTREEVLALK